MPNVRAKNIKVLYLNDAIPGLLDIKVKYKGRIYDGQITRTKTGATKI